MVEKLLPCVFLKNVNWAYNMDQQSQIWYSLFELYVQVELKQNMSKLRCKLPPHLKILKTKKRFVNCLPPHFMHDIWGKIFLTFYSTNWPNLIVWLPLLLLQILGNICIVIICFLICDAIRFENNLSFLSSQFPTWLKKSAQKIKYLKKLLKRF